MRAHWMVISAAVIAAAACANAQQTKSAAPAKPAAAPADLSGTWLFSIDLPPAALQKKQGGVVTVKGIDTSGRLPAQGPVAGALPSTDAPKYRPELQAKVKDLFDHESKTDPVFYCAKPGVPRIGPPRRIIQLPKEMVFLYEDISGDPWRIIPTDGRAHLADANPSAYGDSVGHWEGKKLVVDVTNFADDTWFGEGGYFHSDAMHVTEWLWRDGANLVYQARVEDPKVLAEPWTMAPRVVKPSTEPLEESPQCRETDAGRLDNNDHHQQR